MYLFLFILWLITYTVCRDDMLTKFRTLKRTNLFTEDEFENISMAEKVFSASLSSHKPT